MHVFNNFIDKPIKPDGDKMFLKNAEFYTMWELSTIQYNVNGILNKTQKFSSKLIMFRFVNVSKCESGSFLVTLSHCFEMC